MQFGDFKPRKKCSMSGKDIFEDEWDIDQYIKYEAKIKLYKYKCVYCMGWHLTRKKPKDGR